MGVIKCVFLGQRKRSGGSCFTLNWCLLGELQRIHCEAAGREDLGSSSLGWKPCLGPQESCEKAIERPVGEVGWETKKLQLRQAGMRNWEQAGSTREAQRLSWGAGKILRNSSKWSLPGMGEAKYYPRGHLGSRINSVWKSKRANTYIWS